MNNYLDNYSRLGRGWSLVFIWKFFIQKQNKQNILFCYLCKMNIKKLYTFPASMTQKNSNINIFLKVSEAKTL